VANVLPVTHGLLAIRDLLAGQGFANVLVLFGTEILIGSVYMVVAMLFITVMEKMAKRYGTLGG
jgi:ABC-2 type transport system permease protein